MDNYLKDAQCLKLSALCVCFSTGNSKGHHLCLHYRYNFMPTQAVTENRCCDDML